MAARKPLVVNAGQIQQLQAGDTLDASVAEKEVISEVNGDVGSHVLGDAVYLSAANTVKKARANAAGTAGVIAFATATIATGASGDYQTSGLLAGLAGLTAGAVYYLSKDTAGAITDTAPTAVGELVVRVGRAESTTELLIAVEPAILL